VRPELEVFQSVVEAVVVAVMDLFIGQQRPTESLGHDQPVFDNLSLSSDEMA
jgi:hypothetical protein